MLTSTIGPPVYHFLIIEIPHMSHLIHESALYEGITIDKRNMSLTFFSSFSYIRYASRSITTITNKTGSRSRKFLCFKSSINHNIVNC